MTSLLSNPAVKVPLLIANLICTNISSSSPNPPPKPDEKKVYEVDARSREIMKDWASWFTPIRRNAMHAITIIETVLILARSYPSLLGNTPFSALMPLVTTPSLSRLRTTRTFLIGSAIIYAATLIRLLCYRAMGRHFTFQLAILPHHKLITSGPYALVRHPGYTASVLVNLGVVLYQVGSGSWLREIVMSGTAWRSLTGLLWVCMVTTVSYLLVSRIPKEDLVLRREFGEEWDRWAARTRYRLIPGIY